ncbi:hypothetical protein RHMOL_Rhmol07G0262000 [Rhododendron molle]|uniref:Uncharacterized protein n=1 Tax=Rhododendron molle TaxID=49168 RepID=A0ACC0N6C2_RHOML|nr:hypothetical protein RHMOL_Rhmol07G0262000 [Rhododendron molle]
MARSEGVDNFVIESDCERAMRACMKGSSTDREVQPIHDDARLLIRDLNCHFIWCKRHAYRGCSSLVITLHIQKAPQNCDFTANGPNWSFLINH